MDNIEILAASEVRKLALEIRQKAWRDVINAEGLNSDTQGNRDTSDKRKAEWFRQNPNANYVPQAYEIIRDIALQIRALESDHAQK
jgi:hypothetical protein